MMAEAISLARELNDTNALAYALGWAADLAYCECSPAEVDRLASNLIELCTRHNFVHWLAMGAIWRGWVRSDSGDTVEGIPWIEQGIRDLRSTGAVLGMPSNLARKSSSFSRFEIPKTHPSSSKQSETQFGQRCQFVPTLIVNRFIGAT
jgi:hypothetical protein